MEDKGRRHSINYTKKKWGTYSMGFEDIKTDDSSANNLKQETEKYNNLYFGEFTYLSDGKNKPGQLEKYNESKKKFLEKEFIKVKNFFLSLGWDYIDEGSIYTVRANSNVYLSYQYKENCFIEFVNNDIKKNYKINVESDFRENPYYGLDIYSKGWGTKKYLSLGGEAVSPQMIKERLEKIKVVVEHNATLNGIYNFKLSVDKYANNYNRSKVDIQWQDFDSVMDIIKEISDEYF